MRGEGEDARDVILAARAFLFGEVADEVAAQLVVFGHYIEKKRLDIVVQRFGSKEEFCEKTQVLTVHRILTTVNFEYRDRFVAVDLVSWRVLGWAFELMPPRNIVGAHVFETKFANVQHAVAAVLFRVRRCIPGFDLVPAYSDTLDPTGWS